MDLSIIQPILQGCRIAYAITDARLNVLEVGGVTDIFYNSGHKRCLGRSLLELTPELVGNEAALASILAGELSHIRLNWVNRETAAGQIIYLTLLELPYRDRWGRITGLIHLMQDVTDLGAQDQHLTQQRNEMYLLNS